LKEDATKGHIVKTLTQRLSQSIENPESFELVKNDLLMASMNVFGKGSQYEARIKAIMVRKYISVSTFDPKQNKHSVTGGGNNLKDCVQKIRSISKELLDELEKPTHDSAVIANDLESKIDYATIMGILRTELRLDQLEDLLNLLGGRKQPKKLLAAKINKILKSLGPEKTARILSEVLTSLKPHK
jgi:hypothetical protein